MPSPQESLQNLQKIGQIKAEPPDQVEFDGLVRSARRKLPDADNPALSLESRFTLAYDAAHSLALAALRWHGYRSENRYTVFQVLGHTLSFPPAKWRFLDDCHKKRNIALYDGDFAEDEQLIGELIAVAKELQIAVEALGPVAPAV
ncbi:MAG: hypothetical protein HZC23_15450 [Rhodocyclales bacterium]|nr:hypothetical protein [Rhodocyclales bacterium]